MSSLSNLIPTSPGRPGLARGSRCVVHHSMRRSDFRHTSPLPCAEWRINPSPGARHNRYTLSDPNVSGSKDVVPISVCSPRRDCRRNRLPAPTATWTTFSSHDTTLIQERLRSEKRGARLADERWTVLRSPGWQPDLDLVSPAHCCARELQNTPVKRRLSNRMPHRRCAPHQ